MIIILQVGTFFKVCFRYLGKSCSGVSQFISLHAFSGHSFYDIILRMNSISLGFIDKMILLLN